MWSQLLHTLPAVLMTFKETGEWNGVQYFVENDASIFLSNFPDKKDHLFCEVSELLRDLDELINLE